MKELSSLLGFGLEYFDQVYAKRAMVTKNIYKNTIVNLKTAMHEAKPQNYSQKTLLLHNKCRVGKARIV